MDFDPSNMNNEEFNPLIYIQKYVRNCPLQHVVAKKNHLDHDIQALEADIQGLLYDNYTKIFDASNVISRMSSKMDEMTKDIETLESKVITLRDTSETILMSLKPSKENLQALIRRKSNFAKLTALSNLVPLLTKLINDGENNKAVRQYLKVERAFKKHQTLSSIAGIKEQIDGVMNELKMKWLDELRGDIYGWEDISARIELLLAVGEDKSVTFEAFLNKSQERVDLMLADIDSECGVFKNDMDASLANKKIALLCDFNSKTMDVFTVIYKSTKNKFIENCSEHFASWVSRVLENFLADNIKKLLTKLRQCLTMYFNFVDDYHLANVLDILYRRFHTFFIRTEKIPMFQHNTEFVINICRDRCNHHFNKMVLTYNSLLKKYDERLKSEMCLMDAFNWFQNSYVKIYQDVLPLLKFYIMPEFKYGRDYQFSNILYPGLVKEEIFLKFMEYYLNVIPQKVSQPDEKCRRTSAFIISLSKHALQMAEHKFKDLLFIWDWQTTEISDNSFISIQYKCLAKKLLNNYVETRVNTMTQMIRNSIVNKSWVNAKIPKRVSPAIRHLIEEFAVSLREVQTFFYDSKNRLIDSSSESDPQLLVQHYKNSKLDHNVMISQIHRLFHKSPVHSKEVEFTSDSILSRIMRMTLKSLQELVRQETFNRFGLQQIQIDMYCLQSHIVEHLRTEKDFISLFDDIISSCYCRCLNPEFMNPHVVSAICDHVSSLVTSGRN